MAEERFWKNVNKLGPICSKYGRCWEWTKGKVCKYGHYCVLGESRAHRVSYKLFIEEIPDGLLVLHKCDNPLCVRPSHLFLGTHQDNVKDMVSKRRQAKGDQHGSRTKPQNLSRGNAHYSRITPEKLARGEDGGNVKLTEIAVLEIRRLWADGTYSQHELGRMFGVIHCTIGCIVHRRTWKHI